MKKIVLSSIIVVSLASAVSAASIVCQTTDWDGAGRIVKEEAYSMGDVLPDKGFMTIQTEPKMGSNSGDFVNIVFDNEKAFMCHTIDDEFGERQNCEAVTSVDGIQKKIGTGNKILTLKAFYSTPKGLLSVVAPSPKSEVEVCYIR